jgi:hypothetical protein
MNNANSNLFHLCILGGGKFSARNTTAHKMLIHQVKK